MFRELAGARVCEEITQLIYSAPHDTLVYPADNRLMSITQGAVRLNGTYIGVPATLANLQALRRYEFPIVAPMEKDGYDYPIRAPWSPLPHQRVTSNFLVLHTRCFCFNDMGTMKTLSALWAADYLMRQAEAKGETFRALVVAPLSTLQSVWGDAIWRHFIGRRRAVILHGSAVKRQKLLKESADFYIVNHDGLGVGVSSNRKQAQEGLAADLDARRDIRLAIVDEAAVYRDATTKRHMVARRLIGARDYLWFMTGTPTPNGPLDAYGLAKLVNNANGESFRSYQERTMLRVGPFKLVPKITAVRAATELLQPAIRYAIETCVDLPPCTVQKRDAELSPPQHAAYKRLQRDCVLAMQSGKLVHAVNEAALRMKLIQIACGAIYDTDHETHVIDAGPRLQILKEVIAECREKIIIFAPLTSVVDMLYQTLCKEYECAVIKGAVEQNDRAKIFRDFQYQKAPRIIVADPGTVAHGLTLTAASAVIWYAPTDKTELYLQANKRIDRPGQTKSTNIIQIAATPVEREIYKRLENNQNMMGIILKMVEEGKLK